MKKNQTHPLHLTTMMQSHLLLIAFNAYEMRNAQRHLPTIDALLRHCNLPPTKRLLFDDDGVAANIPQRLYDSTYALMNLFDLRHLSNINDYLTGPQISKERLTMHIAHCIA